jgi:hypothetical protein
MEVYRFARFVLFCHSVDAKMRPLERLHMLHTLHTRTYWYTWAYYNGGLLLLSTVFSAENTHNRLELLNANHFPSWYLSVHNRRAVFGATWSRGRGTLRLHSVF